jgi:transcriptional regulator with XRE-family HTH domain
MIGKKLRELRKGRGWLQQVVAEKLDITVKHYSQLERDKAHPSVSLMQRIANVFGVEVRDLYEKVPEGILEKEPGQPPRIVPIPPQATDEMMRALFKDLAPRLASATTRLAMNLDQLNTGQVEDVLMWGMNLIKVADTIQREGANARSSQVF